MLTKLHPDALATELATAQGEYADLQGQGLALNLTRGKPAPEQLDLAEAMVTKGLTSHKAADGTDCRNYGGLLGLLELREIFAPLFGLPAAQLAAVGNSSLEVMHAVIVSSLLSGPAGDHEPWSNRPVVKFLCPAPGYDRHFSLCAHYGIEMIPVPLTGTGPDMAVVKELVAADENIVGMWCVPQYANPTGETYSAQVVRELASMPTAAPDFRVFWDNAYALHHLSTGSDQVADFVGACADAGNPERAILFASTSKVTFAGAGVAFIGGSAETLAWWTKNTSIRTIGPDKLNQLRHVEFFGSTEGVVAHMANHAKIVTPKFDAVVEALSNRLAGLGIASWTEPTGGYFVLVDVLPGCASRVVELASAAGISLTPAGATHPGDDPEDRYLRLAPTFPVLAEVEVAMAGVATCIALAACEKLTNDN